MSKINNISNKFPKIDKRSGSSCVIWPNCVF